MGCDIHGWVEVKIYDWWFGIIKIDHLVERNYTIFACLADVRNYDCVIPISKPKGLPKDISDEAKEDVEFWGIDGHSHSWLAWEEIKKYDWKSIERGIPPGWKILFNFMKRLAKEYGKENLRLVFWFDN